MRTTTQKLWIAIGTAGVFVTVALACSPAMAAPGGAAAPGSEPKPQTGGGYVNPFATGSWSVSRTDMGVDYMPNRAEPVPAIGRALVLGSSMKSGWPGGAFIWYRLLNGDHAGASVYVAEHLTGLAAAGSVVKAGQPIATALPGYPWTEWGWATTTGEPRAYPCYRDGSETNSGREMARFLRALGEKPLQRLEPGPDRPVGPPC